MNVSLTPELEAWINEKVAGGMYVTASEVVRDALRMFKLQDEVNKQELDRLRAEIQKGLDSLDRGEGMLFDEKMRENIKRRGRARLANQPKENAA